MMIDGYSIGWRVFQNSQESEAIINGVEQFIVYKMLDWQGLLKFTLKYADGTKSSNFTPMSEEDKKWLEEAMQHYCNSEIKRIQNILNELADFTTLKEPTLIALLEELQELLDSLDKGSTLYKMEGHITILKIIFYCKFESCRVLALQIYSAANQNDAPIQNQSIETGALEIIELLKKQESMVLKENMLTAVSATIRGENLQAKRIFIKLEGLQLLLKLSETGSARLKNKIFILLRDLLFYDDRLHYTYNDLSSFSNTNNLKVEKPEHYDLSYDPNQLEKEKNELPQNAKYKGAIRRFMDERKPFLMEYLQWLKQQVKQESSAQ